MADTALDFIGSFTLGDAPGEAISAAKRSLLDLIGVAAAGSCMAVSRIIRSPSLRPLLRLVYAAPGEGEAS